MKNQQASPELSTFLAAAIELIVKADKYNSTVTEIDVSLIDGKELIELAYKAGYPVNDSGNLVVLFNGRRLLLLRHATRLDSEAYTLTGYLKIEDVSFWNKTGLKRAIMVMADKLPQVTKKTLTRNEKLAFCNLYNFDTNEFNHHLAQAIRTGSDIEIAPLIAAYQELIHAAIKKLKR
jgi:hypothetical protein